MGMASASKLRRVLANTERVVASELLCAAQGLEFHRPLRSSEAIEALHQRIREIVRPLDADRPLTRDIENLVSLVRKEALA